MEALEEDGANRKQPAMLREGKGCVAEFGACHLAKITPRQQSVHKPIPHFFAQLICGNVRQPADGADSRDSDRRSRVVRGLRQGIRVFARIDSEFRSGHHPANPVP